jgi:hypothetical protein
VIRASSLRFLLVVSPPAMWMYVAFAASVLMGAATLWLNPKDVDSAFGSILLLQMFSASSGFAGSAAHGYFDPILASGRSRNRIAMGSLVASTVPGIAAWLIIVLIAAALGQAGTALRLHRFVALILVSTIAWAGGLALPRMAAGGLWAFVLLTVALSRGAVADYLVVVQSPPAGIQDALASAAAFAICPYLLLGEFSAASDPIVIGADLCVALTVAWSGFRFIGRREYSLVQPA